MPPAQSNSTTERMFVKRALRRSPTGRKGVESHHFLLPPLPYCPLHCIHCHQFPYLDAMSTPMISSHSLSTSAANRLSGEEEGGWVAHAALYITALGLCFSINTTPSMTLTTELILQCHPAIIIWSRIEEQSKPLSPPTPGLHNRMYHSL